MLEHMQSSFDNAQSEYKELLKEFTNLKFKVSDFQEDFDHKLGQITEHNKHAAPSLAQVHFDMRALQSDLNKIDMNLTDKIKAI